MSAPAPNLTTPNRCVQSPQNKKQCIDADNIPVQEIHDLAALPGLPDHLVYSILIELPIWDLLRFRFFSKRWNAIMQSRSFNMELLEVKSRKELQEQCSVTSVIFWENLNPETHTCGTLVKLRGDKKGDVFQDTLSLKFPVFPCDDVWMSKYSCDGIFCLICERSFASLCHPRETRIVLWNPLTEWYKEFPWPSDVLHRYYGVNTFVGFGYDQSISDYKIVVICFAPCFSDKNMIKVRTLKSDVWKTIRVSSTYSNMIRSYGILEPVGVGEAVYWIGHSTTEKSPSILKFNLAEEKLTTISFPRMNINKIISVRLGKFNGSLYAYVYGIFRNDDQKLVEVRKYSKHKNKMEWEKTLIINKESMPKGFQVTNCLELLGFTRNGNFLLSVENALLAYVPQYNKCVEIKINEGSLPKNSSYQIHLLENETMISP